jgi:hypothetical protein
MQPVPVKIFCFLMLWSLVVPLQAASSARTLARVVDPVVATGADLPQLIGAPANDIRVFAFREGRAEVIPFQIDQRDSHGNWVWDVVYRKRFAFIDEDAGTGLKREPRRHGRGTVDDQDPRGQALLDANDELVFMAADAGDREPAARRLLEAETLLEMELSESGRDARAWVYIAGYKRSPPPLATTRYMHYDALDRQVTTPVYGFHFSDDHMALIHDLSVNGVTIVDRIRIHGEITVNLPLPNRRVKFSERDIRGYTEGYIAGPVRIIKRNIAHFSMLGGLIRASNVTCDNFYYPRHAEIPVCLSIGFPVQQVEMTLTTDYRDPPFNRLYMGGAPLEHDSVSDSLRARLRRLGTEWIVLAGDQATLTSLVVLPDTTDGEAEALPCLCESGQHPLRARVGEGTATETGFVVTSSAECPEGDHVLYGTYVITTRPYVAGDEAEALKLKHDRLGLRVSRVPPAE